MLANYKRLIFVSVFGGVAIAVSLIGIIFFPKESCGCGKQIEAQTYTKAMNRVQQANFLEKRTFLNSVPSDSGK
jgi:hypothetical protein